MGPLPEYEFWCALAEGSTRGLFKSMTDLLSYFAGKEGYPKRGFPSGEDGFMVYPTKENLELTLPLGFWFYRPIGSDDKIRMEFLALIADLIKRVGISVKILTVSGLPWSKNTQPIYKAIQERGRDVFYRFLLVNPEDERGKEIILERQRIGCAQKNEYFGEIETCRNIVKGLKNKKITAELKFYSDYPFWRLFIVNNKFVFVQTYPEDKAGDYSEAFGFHNLAQGRYSLADFFIYLFDKMFDEGLSEEDLAKKRAKKEAED